MNTDPLDAGHVSADAVADERERQADERQRVADERERQADDREQRLAAWETRLDTQARAQNRAIPSHRQRSYEAIERARGLVEASRERLDRNAAALRRADARDEREQRIVDGEAADTRQRQADERPSAQQSAPEDRA
ncbi:hypothetical protein LXH13_14330 [Streptomyces spinosirectus]|uniref:hypothetical protein n=1 Tax=Streptomyces TaxID=1883 RepID=UPI000FFE4C89|nr:MULTISPECIES: hypothetical protein [Streptomyces]MBY8343114.1 hypothetical protein [Streptomyces plumbidurans]UIR18148.1 hypothetical protein LXH13_14330 [Streptomyces spinosirectus]